MKEKNFTLIELLVNKTCLTSFMFFGLLMFISCYLLYTHSAPATEMVGE